MSLSLLARHPMITNVIRACPPGLRGNYIGITIDPPKSNGVAPKFQGATPKIPPKKKSHMYIEKP